MLRPETPSLGVRLRSRTRHADWLTSALLLLAISLLLVSYQAVVVSFWWLPQPLLLIALVLAICAILRRLGAAFPWVGGAIVWLLGLVWLFAPASTFALFPTPASIRVLGRLLSDGLRIAWLEPPPVPDAAAVTLLLAAGFGLFALLLDFLLLGLRRAIPAGVLLFGVYVFPSVASGNAPNVWVFAGVAALWLILLYAERRYRDSERSYETVGGMLLTSAVAIAALAVSVGLPPVLPHVGGLSLSWGNGPPGAFDRGINPIVELGQNLRRSNRAQALTYATSGQQPPYLKVANLLDFNGKVWRPSSGAKFAGTDGLVTLEPDVKRTLINTDISITGLRSSMLPVPYPAVRNQGATGDWQWNSQGRTISSTTSSSKDQTYRASSLLIEPTLDQLEASDTVISADLEPYVHLPADINPVIARTAHAATIRAATDYDRALALQEFFRGGAFIYSETAPVSAGYDGSGVAVMVKFLKAKSGYCVHFASTMAVMARTLGIPARIAVGYAPGEPFSRTKTGAVIYEVTNRDLHAWPELFFAGIGWLAFEPTPGVGAPQFEPPVVPGALVSPDRVAQLAAMSARNRPDDIGFSASPKPTPGGTTAYWQLPAGLGGLLLIGLTPLLIRGRLRRRRLRSSGHFADRCWLELECTARDYGMFVTAAESPRVFAAELAQRPGIDTAALARLLEVVEQERYGPTDSTRTPIGTGIADVRAVLASFETAAGRTQRFRAVFAPASLAGRRTITVRPIVA